MKKFRIHLLATLLAVVLMSFSSIVAEAPAWKVDMAHSSVSFEVTHFFTPVKGYFKRFETELRFDPENLEGSFAQVIIAVSSVDTDEPKRDKHLQSEDFFDEASYPEIKFVAGKFSKTEEGYLVSGKLTIRDITKEVDIPFKVLGLGEHPMKKGRLLTAMRGELILNRNVYGVGSGSWAATAVVGDEVKITVVLEANRARRAI